MTVYLLHLERPLSRGISPSGQPLVAAHYIGWTDDLVGRLDDHVSTTWQPLPEAVIENGKKRRGEKHGQGATFMGFVNFMHIDWKLARTWDGADQGFESRLKKFKKAPWLCPFCTPNALDHMKLEAVWH